MITAQPRSTSNTLRGVRPRGQSTRRAQHTQRSIDAFSIPSSSNTRTKTAGYLRQTAPVSALAASALNPKPVHTVRNSSGAHRSCAADTTACGGLAALLLDASPASAPLPAPSCRSMPKDCCLRALAVLAALCVEVPVALEELPWLEASLVELLEALHPTG